MKCLDRKELKMGSLDLPAVSYCQLNISQCQATEMNNRFVVNVYNNLARNIDKYVRIPIVSSNNYEVLDNQGKIS